MFTKNPSYILVTIDLNHYVYFFLINISTAVNLTTLKDTQSLFIKWFLVICILTPFIIFGYHVITLWYAEENKYKKITMRKTTSTVDALALQMNEEIPSGNTDGKTNDGQNNMNTTNNGMFLSNIQSDSNNTSINDINKIGSAIGSINTIELQSQSTIGPGVAVTINENEDD